MLHCDSIIKGVEGVRIWVSFCVGLSTYSKFGSDCVGVEGGE